MEGGGRWSPLSSPGFLCLGASVGFSTHRAEAGHVLPWPARAVLRNSLHCWFRPAFSVALAPFSCMPWLFGAPSRGSVRSSILPAACMLLRTRPYHSGREGLVFTRWRCGPSAHRRLSVGQLPTLAHFARAADVACKRSRYPLSRSPLRGLAAPLLVTGTLTASNAASSKEGGMGLGLGTHGTRPGV